MTRSASVCSNGRDSIGADIAVAEGQCLGNSLTYGGPYLGLLSCREQFVRKMPGRLVGQTVDRNGKRCWVLTMQRASSIFAVRKPRAISARIKV